MLTASDAATLALSSAQNSLFDQGLWRGGTQW
jgi:hypothetical protein